jgi:hypothetical protein
MLFVSCQTLERKVDVSYRPNPFQFNTQTEEWLRQCEKSTPPPLTAILDFDRLQKKYHLERSILDKLELSNP